MRSRSYFLDQAEECRRLAKEAADRSTAVRLHTLAEDYEFLAQDMAGHEHAAFPQQEARSSF